MKIGIVTFYCTNNCGAVLQCYALGRVLRSLFPDAQVSVLDFLHGSRRHAPSMADMYMASFRKNHSHIKSVFHVADAVYERLRAGGHALFQDFVEENCHLDVNAYLSADGCLNCTGYDVLVAGSDQVFVGNRPYFYLDTTQLPEPQKVAYAPSFGHLENIEPSHHEWIRKRLNTFAALSCREADGCRLVEDLTGRSCPAVLDPTMLMEAIDWRELCRPPRHAPKGDFVFSYELWRCPHTIRAAQRAAQELGVPLVRARYYSEGSKYYNHVGPREFLWLVSHAKHVVTQSFHGSVFSLLFGTPFHVVSTSAPQSRMHTLLEYVSQQNRRIASAAELDLSAPSLSAEEAARLLAVKREESLAYLRDSVQG